MKQLLVLSMMIISQSSFAQNIGIGLTAPLVPLHIANGTAGNATPFGPLVVESNNSTYINILSPNNKETAILFGKTDNAASGAIVYNNLNVLNGFQFRTNGNITQMTLNNAGNLGIGVTSPTAKLSISANGTPLTGTVLGNTIISNAGILPNTIGSEIRLANIGFLSTNNSSFGISAYRSSAGNDWTTTALVLGYDVDNTPRASSNYLALSAGGNMGINTVTPHPSALLDVTSTTRGMLPPRMTTLQRDAIANPAQGLMLFNTTTQSLEVFTNYGWFGLQLHLPERKLLGGGGTEEVFSIQLTTDGGCVIVGRSTSSASGDVTEANHSTQGSADFWVVKLDANRNIQWNKLLGGDQEDHGYSVQQTIDGGYIIAGYSNSSATGNVSGTNHGNADYWIVKLDGNGNFVWDKLIGGAGDDRAQSIRQSPDGTYIVAGYSNSSNSGNINLPNHGGYDYWIVKLDGNGEIMWQKLIGGSGDDQAFDITVQPSDGTFVAVGKSSSSANGDVTGTNHGGPFPIDTWIVRLSDINGAIIWNKLLGGTGEDFTNSIEATPEGGYIIAGSSSSSANGDVTDANHGSGGSFDYWIIKMDRFGNITWNKLLGGNSFDKAYSIKRTADAGYIVTGFSNSTASGNVTGINHGFGEEYWVAKMDGTGIFAWDRLLGGNLTENAYGIIQTTDGGYLVAGHTTSSYNGDVTGGNHSPGTDIWIIKLGSNGYLY